MCLLYRMFPTGDIAVGETLETAIHRTLMIHTAARVSGLKALCVTTNNIENTQHQPTMRVV